MTITEQQQIKDTTKPIEIRIFTLNIWGIPVISRDRKERVKAIAQHLICVHEPYHYVFLQEVWSKSDFKFISDKVSKLLPYSHYFYSGVMGSGTCIFSCSPIQEVHFHPFSLNGYPHRILHGDWFGGKGLALCKTTFMGIPILLVNTHLHAEYDNKDDEYLHHRVVQAFELSQSLRFAQLEHHVAIFAGDLNCTADDVPYRLIASNTGYIDTFLDSATKSPDGIGATCESPSNSYTTVKALKLNPNGKRIDYIFYMASNDYQVKTKVHDQPLPPRIPEANFSFSDHEGVRAILTIKQKQADREIENASSDSVCFNRTYSLLDASSICIQGLRIVSRSQKIYAWVVTVLFFIQFIVLGCLFLDISAGGRFCLYVVLIASAVFIAFNLYMAAIFCNQEYCAVRNAKEGMDKLLDEVRIKNGRYFEEQRKKSLVTVT